MSLLNRSLGLAFAFAGLMAAPVFAQETTPAAPAPEAAAPEGTGLSMGEDAAATTAAPYVKSTHGDWQLRCVRAKDGSDPCEIYQLLKDEKGNSVAEVTMVALPDGQDAAAGATIIVPLETLLPAQLTLAVDGGKAKRYPFTFCAVIGCFSRIGFTGAEIEAMQKGSKATVSVVPIVAPDQVVSVDISLKGFTEAYEAVKAERPQP